MTRTIEQFAYAGVTDLDYDATARAYIGAYVADDGVPVDGVDVHFTGTMGDFLETTGTPFPPGVTAFGVNRGPNPATTTYTSVATVTGAATTSPLSITWHHAPDVGVPTYISPTVIDALVSSPAHIELNWAGPVLPVDSHFPTVSYLVQRATTITGPWTDVITTTTALTHIDGPLATTGIYYFYRVQTSDGLTGGLSPVIAIFLSGGTRESWGMLAR